MLDRFSIQSQMESGDFSGVIEIRVKGEPLLQLARGYADLELKVLNDIDTLFNLGSNSKMFTAVAIAQLAERGALCYSDPLGHYLPSYPNPEVKGVTLHQLLTHTGGTGDIFGPAFNAHIEDLKEPSDFIRLFGQRDLEFPPGERFAYSNYGYILLGAVIEAVSHESYDHYIKENIYRVAGMCSSDSYWKNERVDHMAVGYMREGLELTPNWSLLPMRGMPTGGSYSTAGDLARFAQALFEHRLLSSESLKLITTGKVGTPDGQKYAYGFRDRTEKNGLRWVGHSGGGPGANTTLRIYPDRETILIVLSNIDYPAADRLADFVSQQIS